MPSIIIKPHTSNNGEPDIGVIGREESTLKLRPSNNERGLQPHNPIDSPLTWISNKKIIMMIKKKTPTPQKKNPAKVSSLLTKQVVSKVV